MLISLSSRSSDLFGVGKTYDLFCHGGIDVAVVDRQHEETVFQFFVDEVSQHGCQGALLLVVFSGLQGTTRRPVVPLAGVPWPRERVFE